MTIIRQRTVGRSTSFLKRQRMHRSQSAWWNQIGSIWATVMESKEEMDAEESRLIRLLQPTFNIADK